MLILKSFRVVGALGLAAGLVWTAESYGQGFSSAGGAHGGGSRGGGVRAGGVRSGGVASRGARMGGVGSRSIRGGSMRGLPGGSSTSFGKRKNRSQAVRRSHSEPLTDQVLLNPRRRPRSPSNPIAPAIPTIGGSAVGFVHRGKSRNGLRFGRGHGLSRHHGHRFGVPSVVFPYGYGYGYRGYDADYSRTYVSEVEPETVARPYAQYVIPGRSSEVATAGAKIYEVQPTDPDASGASGVERVDSSSGTSTPPAEVSNGPVYYLIALKGGPIYTSQEHWLQGGVLHFVTAEGKHNRVTLGQVDMDFTVQLNRERGLQLVIEVRDTKG